MISKRKSLRPKIKPNSFWFVIYECRYSVIAVGPDATWFSAPGQDALWHIDNIRPEGWLVEIIPGQTIYIPTYEDADRRYDEAVELMKKQRAEQEGK